MFQQGSIKFGKNAGRALTIRQVVASTDGKTMEAAIVIMTRNAQSKGEEGVMTETRS